MSISNTIAMTACNRPNYTRKVINSLSNCVGVENATLIPHVEPINEEVISLFKSIDFCDVKLTVNNQRLGHTLNTHNALKEGFENGDYVVLIEDDTVLAQDFLLFHNFCRENFKEDNSVYTVSAGHYRNPNEIIPKEFHFSYEFQNRFSNQGWGTWIDRWEEKGGMKSTWENRELILGSIYQVQYKYGGWDALLNNFLRKNRKEIIPTMSRVQNIGAIGGVHSITPQDHEETIKVKDWAGNFNFTNNEFHINNV